MDILQDYTPDIVGFVSLILAVVLVYSSKKLIGKNWLLAFTITTLISRCFILISIIVARQTGYTGTAEYSWMMMSNVFTHFSTACLGIFLFNIWSGLRMDVDTKRLLFSFTGRIPRSAFWILTCILIPLSTLLSHDIFSYPVSGFLKLIIWAIYICWNILNIWISLAIYAKRWHDCSKSGWMSLILLIPIIGPLWQLVYLGFVKGTKENNPYGENPLYLHKS